MKLSRADQNEHPAEPTIDGEDMLSFFVRSTRLVEEYFYLRGMGQSLSLECVKRKLQNPEHRTTVETIIFGGESRELDRSGSCYTKRVG